MKTPKELARLRGGPRVLSTIDMLREAQRDALEAAAKICDDHWAACGTIEDADEAECARRIRELKP